MNDSPPQSNGPGKRTLKRLALLGVAMATLGSLGVGITVFGILPWLGRRGDLNPLIEELLSSSLTVPVRIAHVDSHPLSEFTVTELRSVEFEAQGRLHFSTQKVSLTYDPIELLSGHLRKLQLERPEVLIHLGSDLASVAQLPTAAGQPWQADEDALLPVTIDRLRLVDASVTVQLDERRTRFDGLELEVDRLGWKVGQEFRLVVAAFGGSVRASGRLDVLAGQPPRYALQDVQVSMTGVRLGEIVEWLAPGALLTSDHLPRGQLSLDGTLSGTWPERVELQLASAGDGIVVHPAEQLHVQSGEFDLQINTVVLGELEQVTLQLDSRARAAWSSQRRQGDDRATLHLEATYVSDADGGKLRIQPLRFQLRDDSHVEITGEVRTRDNRPELQLAVDAGGLDVAEALGHLEHYVPLAAVWQQIEGKVSFHSTVKGSLDRPEFSGRFEVTELRHREGENALTPGLLSGNYGGLRVDPVAETLECDWLQPLLRSDEAAETVAFLTRLIPQLDLGEFAIDGPLEIALDARALRLPYQGEPFDVTANLSAQPSSLHASLLDARDVNVQWHADTHWLPDEVTFQTALSLDVAEFLTGPFYYSRLTAETFDLRGRGKIACKNGRPHSLEISECAIKSPVTGPVAASATFPFADDTRPRFRLKGSSLPLGPALAFFLIDPLKESFPFLETLEASGATQVTIESQFGGGALGRFQLTDGDLVCGRLQLAGCHLTLPFLLGGAGPDLPEPGHLEARRISRGFVTAAAVQVPFELEGRTYRLTARVEQELLGGILEIPSAEYSLTDPIELTAVVHGRGFDLGEITTSASLPHIPGQVAVELDRIVVRGDSLDCAGSLKINAFGGHVQLSDISLSNLLEPYSNISLRRGSLKGIDLGQFGTVFRVGILSGVLDGDVTDLGFTAGQVTSFDLDVQAVPRPGVPQFVDRRAIESLRSIVEGRVGVLEKTLASRFRYGKFGFRARLANGQFRIQGKYPDEGKEYIMYPYWYQFPKITIVNSQSEPYPWEAILGNFDRIYSEDDA